MDRLNNPAPVLTVTVAKLTAVIGGDSLVHLYEIWFLFSHMLPFTHSFGCESTVGKLFSLFNTKKIRYTYFTIISSWKYELFFQLVSLST